MNNIDFGFTRQTFSFNIIFSKVHVSLDISSLEKYAVPLKQPPL